MSTKLSELLSDLAREVEKTERESQQKDRRIATLQQQQEKLVHDLEHAKAASGEPHDSSDHTHPELKSKMTGSGAEGTQHGDHVLHEGQRETKEEAKARIEATQQQQAKSKAPSAPRNVRTTGYPRATVSWDPPEEEGSGYLNYTVLLTPDGGSESGLTPQRQSTRTMRLSLYLREKGGTVKVMASTPHGRATSESVAVAGKQPVVLPTAPRNVRIDGNTLHWDEPDQTGPGAVKYSVMACKRNGEWVGVGSRTRDLSIDIRIYAEHYDLVAWKVAAHNQDGSGPFCNPVRT